MGTDIAYYWDDEPGAEAEMASFAYTMSDSKELYVEVVLHNDAYRIKSWLMRDTLPWEFDIFMPVWTGEGEDL